MDNMCSVPISMFHMFNLDDHFENHFEKEEGQDNLPDIENVPKKSDTSVKKLLPIVYSEKTYRKNLFKNCKYFLILLSRIKKSVYSILLHFIIHS